jgi:hypothetical protein
MDKHSLELVTIVLDYAIRWKEVKERLAGEHRKGKNADWSNLTLQSKTY